MPAPVRLFTLAILGVALPASALPEIDGACSAQPMQWGCVGQLDVRSKESAVRMSGYRNKEILVELDSGGKRQRLLVRGGVAIIDTRPTGHEFDFWGYAFAIPLAALQRAFPAGPLSVPAAPVSHQVEIEFKKRSHVTAWRLVDGEIRYRIVTPSEPSLEGSYRAGLLPELPGDFDLRGWYIAPSPQRLGAPPQAPQPAPVERLEQLR